MTLLPSFLRTFSWDHDPGTLDAQPHAFFVMERLMGRGSWEAMQWLLASFLGQSTLRFSRGSWKKSFVTQVAAQLLGDQVRYP